MTNNETLAHHKSRLLRILGEQPGATIYVLITKRSSTSRRVRLFACCENNLHEITSSAAVLIFGANVRRGGWGARTRLNDEGLRFEGSGYSVGNHAVGFLAFQLHGNENALKEQSL